MPKCGGQNDCSEDAITLDELEDEHCVSFNNQCVSCGTVLQIKSNDKSALEKDPINKLFGHPNANSEEILKLRSLIQERCNIELKEPLLLALQKINGVDLIKARANITIVLREKLKMKSVLLIVVTYRQDYIFYRSV